MYDAETLAQSCAGDREGDESDDFFRECPRDFVPNGKKYLKSLVCL